MKLTKIFLQIEKEITSGHFVLPALPAIAIRVRKAVKDPMMDLAKLATVVSFDASFTAYLMGIANSPIYRGVDTIDSVPIAIGRLGMQSTRTTSLIFAIRSLFQTKNPLCKKLLSQIWLQSCKVSALAFVMATELKTATPERASIAGLLHNIGLISVIVKLVEQGESEAEIIANWGTIEIFSKRISGRILNHWQLENDVKEVCRGIYDWTEVHTEPLVELINLSIWHSRLGTSRFKSLPKLNQLAYFQTNPMLKLDHGESLLFVKESQKEINAMMQALNG